MQLAPTDHPAASTDPERTDLPAESGYVLARLGGGRYGIGMSAIAEVGRMPRITRIPGTPPWLAGAANWRGRILGVLDLRPLLGVEAPPVGSLGRLIVISDGSVTVGMVTEGVQGVVSCAELEPVPQTLEPEIAVLLLGQFTVDYGPVAVLDPAAVLNLRHKLPRARG
ncbi:MAG: chemotaxis protein CheW [Acidothermus sp.]|nr:chemotaxis protein CheW [Acidothermus sp.]